MPHSQSFDAIVLKTYDVGEADRFCILLTRERGRISARAAGARRLQSKLGGSLLPFSRLAIELKESGSAWIVAGVSAHKDAAPVVSGAEPCRAPTHRFLPSDVSTFMDLEEGVELLMRLVTDEGALPEIFDLTLAFLSACQDGVSHAGLAYGFALLHSLGFLPDAGEMQDMEPMASDGHAYVEACRKGVFAPPERGCDSDQLYALQSLLLEGHMNSPLRAKGVRRAMA